MQWPNHVRNTLCYISIISIAKLLIIMELHIHNSFSIKKIYDNKMALAAHIAYSIKQRPRYELIRMHGMLETIEVASTKMWNIGLKVFKQNMELQQWPTTNE